MAGTSQTFGEKVNLIYEYNKKSPLFVRVANNELEKNNFQKAFEILNEGLTLFPDYPVAHIMLGKTLNLLGKYKEALEAFRRGSELLNSPGVYEHYRHEVDKVKKQRIFLAGDNTDKPENKNINLQEELSSFDSMDTQRAVHESIKSGNDSIISETLANIYINQGEFREAVKIFEKLIIKNPQKKEYYLQKINDIKAKLE